MAIKQEMQVSDFQTWLARDKDSSYHHYFSYEGAAALFEYLEQLSDDMGEDLDWDPIAWCVGYSEFDDFDQFQHDTGYTQNGIVHKGYPDIDNLDDLRDHTTVIECENGHIIVEDF